MYYMLDVKQQYIRMLYFRDNGFILWSGEEFSLQSTGKLAKGQLDVVWGSLMSQSDLIVLVQRYGTTSHRKFLRKF